MIKDPAAVAEKLGRCLLCGSCQASCPPGVQIMDVFMDQSCCGLPLEMMGQRKTSIDVAKQNIAAFRGGNYDYIITLCASCAGHLKHHYPEILDSDYSTVEAQAFADKIIDFSSFVHDLRA